MAAKSEWMSENKCIAMLSWATCHLVRIQKRLRKSISHAGIIGEKQKRCFPKGTCIHGRERFLCRCLCATERSPRTQSVACGSFSPAGRDILRPIVIWPRGENLDQPRKPEKHAGDAKIAQRPYLLRRY